MNIELDEVVVLDVSDDALELAAGGAQGRCSVGFSLFNLLRILRVPHTHLGA